MQRTRLLASSAPRLASFIDPLGILLPSSLIYTAVDPDESQQEGDHKVSSMLGLCVCSLRLPVNGINVRSWILRCAGTTSVADEMVTFVCLCLCLWGCAVSLSR